VAYLISDMLADRYARMRAFGASSPLDIDRPAAAKTGTTSDWRDNWTVGYTPDRAVGVWVGNPDGSPMRGISGISGAGPLWHDMMLAAHRGLPAHAFARPGGIVELAVCADSGLLPAPACPATRRERFVAGSAPTRPDDRHLAVRLDPRLGCLAPPGYPAERSITRSFYLPPPGAEAWAAQQKLPKPPRVFCPAPAAAGGAIGADTSAAPVPVRPDAPTDTPTLLTPGDGAAFRLTPGVPPERQRIALEAQAGAAAEQVTIFVDGVAVAQLAAAPYRAFWQLTPGAHTAWAEVRDASGNLTRSEDVRFTVST
jgi:membrane carboxypeptidase/penicillin-binding protein PbpC